MDQAVVWKGIYPLQLIHCVRRGPRFATNKGACPKAFGDAVALPIECRTSDG